MKAKAKSESFNDKLPVSLTTENSKIGK